MDGVQAKHESIFLSSYFTSYKLVISWIGNHPCILLNAEKRNQDPSFSPHCSPAIAINLQLRLGLAKLQTLTLFTLPPICYCFSVLTCDMGTLCHCRVRASQVTGQSPSVLLLVVTLSCTESNCTHLVGLVERKYKKKII